MVSSPYSPSTRRFLNPMYLRIEDVLTADEIAARAGSSAPALSAAPEPILEAAAEEEADEADVIEDAVVEEQLAEE